MDANQLASIRAFEKPPTIQTIFDLLAHIDQQAEEVRRLTLANLNLGGIDTDALMDQERESREQLAEERERTGWFEREYKEQCQIALQINTKLARLSGKLLPAQELLKIRESQLAEERERVKGLEKIIRLVGCEGHGKFCRTLDGQDCNCILKDIAALQGEKETTSKEGRKF